MAIPGNAFFAERLARLARVKGWEEAALVAMIRSGSSEGLAELGLEAEAIEAERTRLLADGWTAEEAYVIALIKAGEGRL